MSRVRLRNPQIPDIGTLLVVGGLAFLAFNPNVQRVLRQLGPDPESNEPGPPGPGVPATQFRIVRVDMPRLVVAGADFGITWTVSHVGPAGSVQVGSQLSLAHYLWFLGQHNVPFQTISTTLQVGEDHGWTTYTPSASAPLQAGHLQLVMAQHFIQGTSNAFLAEQWDNWEINVL